MNDLCNQPGPTTLVRCAETTARVAVEELVEPQVILPVLIEIEQIGMAVDSPAPFVISCKQMLHSVLEFLGDMTQVHVITRTGWTLDLERVAVEHVETEERLDQQEVHTEPNRPTPIAITAEKSAVRIPGYVAHLESLAIHVHRIRVFLVKLGHGTHTVLCQELGLVEHPLQDLLQPFLAHKCQKKSIIFTPAFDASNIALGNICLVFNKPVQSSLERWELVDYFRLESQNRVKWNKANQRPDGQLLSPRATIRDGVVVEADFR